jgi:hypothetical protein
MKISVGAAAAITLFATQAVHAQGAVQWKVSDGGNGHWYQLIAGPVNWTSASAAAAVQGAHLTTLGSEAEARFVRLLGQETCLIGLYQDTSDPGYGEPSGGWRWVTPEPVSYSNWRINTNGQPNEPNDGIGEGGENWAVIDFGAITWNDVRDNPVSSACIEWSADCNNDGIVDYGQCRDGSLPDYNGNNIPDCCEAGAPCVVGNYPVQWRVADGGNGHWYQLKARATPVSWTAANAESASIEGHLATLTSAAENQWVFSNVAAGPDGWNCGSDCYGPWLGGYQDPQDPSFSEPAGGWKWVTGETWGFAPWSCELPNDADPLQDFLHFYSVSWCSPAPGPRWDDLQDGGAGRVSSFVIEWSADCNSDGIVDKGQILRGQLPDVNGNGIPDVCERPTCVDADIYRDFNVNGADLGILLSQWGPNTPLTESDLNDDGVVSGADLGLLLSFWGACP